MSKNWKLARTHVITLFSLYLGQALWKVISRTSQTLSSPEIFLKSMSQVPKPKRILASFRLRNLSSERLILLLLGRWFCAWFDPFADIFLLSDNCPKNKTTLRILG